MRPSRHVVVGAGPLGLAVATECLAAAEAVRIVTRSGTAAGLPTGAESVAADVADPAQARRALAGADIVHFCAAPPYHLWPELFPALQEGVIAGAAAAGAVLVAAENLYAYGVAGRLTEQMPLAARTRKGAVRARMHERLMQAHARGEVRAVAGRAADFIGPGVRRSVYGERLWPALLDGRGVSWIGDPDTPHATTYVPDHARALVRLGRTPAAWGRAWHVPSLPALTPRALITRAADIAGLPAPRIRRMPRAMLRLAGLFVPDAREVAETAYLLETALEPSHTAYAALVGEAGGVTPVDTVLSATLAFWRAEAAAGRASRRRMRESASGVIPR